MVLSILRQRHSSLSPTYVCCRHNRPAPVSSSVLPTATPNVSVLKTATKYISIFILLRINYLVLSRLVVHLVTSSQRTAIFSCRSWLPLEMLLEINLNDVRTVLHWVFRFERNQRVYISRRRLKTRSKNSRNRPPTVVICADFSGMTYYVEQPTSRSYVPIISQCILTVISTVEVQGITFAVAKRKLNCMIMNLPQRNSVAKVCVKC